VVRDVGRHHADHLGAVGPGRLGLRHAAIVGVAARGVEPQVAAGFDRPIGIEAEGARHQLVAVVEAGGDAMRLADEGAAPAAHHAQAETARRPGRRAHRR